MTAAASSLPAVGDLAPDFTLPSTGGGEVTLGSLRGSNVVLAFFPLAFTGVCTAEMCCFTEDASRFRDVNALVYGISVDSIPTLEEFKKQHGIEVTLLSDFKREVCRAYGTLHEEAFFANRAYVIIDGDGVVRWAWCEADLGDRRENDELIARLQEIAP